MSAGLYIEILGAQRQAYNEHAWQVNVAVHPRNVRQDHVKIKSALNVIFLSFPVACRMLNTASTVEPLVDPQVIEGCEVGISWVGEVPPTDEEKEALMVALKAAFVSKCILPYTRPAFPDGYSRSDQPFVPKPAATDVSSVVAALVTPVAETDSVVVDIAGILGERNKAFIAGLTRFREALDVMNRAPSQFYPILNALYAAIVQQLQTLPPHPHLQGTPYFPVVHYFTRLTHRLNQKQSVKAPIGNTLEAVLHNESKHAQRVCTVLLCLTGFALGAVLGVELNILAGSALCEALGGVTASYVAFTLIMTSMLAISGGLTAVGLVLEKKREKQWNQHAPALKGPMQTAMNFFTTIDSSVDTAVVSSAM
jgi:hypothetical protein